MSRIRNLHGCGKGADNMSSFWWFLFFFILITPGIYLALLKNFLIIPNKKYNIFPIRLIFTVTGTAIFLVIFLLLLFLFFGVILENYSNALISAYGDFVILIYPLLCSLLTILMFKAYLIRDDEPIEFRENFFDYELYVYKPLKRITGGRECGTKIDYPKNMQPDREILTGTQMEDLRLNLKELKEEKIALTGRGELIISDEALDIFNQNNLTGFSLRPVKNYKNSEKYLNLNYFQFVSTHHLPSVSSKSAIIKEMKAFAFRVYIKNDVVYYSQKIMNNISDFNTSREVFGAYDGSPYYPQHLWIVTNKVMKILIEDLNQNKRDFIPIHLVDDEI